MDKFNEHLSNTSNETNILEQLYEKKKIIMKYQYLKVGMK